MRDRGEVQVVSEELSQMVKPGLGSRLGFKQMVDQVLMVAFLIITMLKVAWAGLATHYVNVLFVFYIFVLKDNTIKIFY